MNTFIGFMNFNAIILLYMVAESDCVHPEPFLSIILVIYVYKYWIEQASQRKEAFGWIANLNGEK